MVYLLSFVILASSLNLGILQVSAVVERIPVVTKTPPTSTVGAGEPTSGRRLHHPLPPVAMPGILKDFEPSLAPRGRRELLTELRFLKNNILPLEKPVMRKRRSAEIPQTISQMMTFTGSRNKRDLRRLRRDLGYNNPNFASLDDFSNPSYILPTKPHHQNPQYQRPTVPVRTPELSRLLRGLNFLEQLAVLTQEREIPPIGVAEQRRPFHAPPSRFAPQPKLFMDENHVQSRPSRTESPLNWNDPEIREPYVWRPEKRWSGMSGWRGVSMVPGAKRSVFREASMDHHQPHRFGMERGEMLNAPHAVNNDINSLAAILGTELDPEENRIRRAAM